MSIKFINVPNKIPSLTLQRDLTKHIKRGDRWIFADCFSKMETTPSGLGILKSKNDEVALGIVQSDTQLRFRILQTSDDRFWKKGLFAESLNSFLAHQWSKAVALRSMYPHSETNSFRLINGEGDGFPGLVIDIYFDTAVIKHDHPIMEELWDRYAIARLITQDFPRIGCVYYKRRNDDDSKGENLVGQLRSEVQFLENGVSFASNIRDAAKTGFFLDQRDNRKLISQFSKDKSVLNLFSYTGGFSLFAAKGGATEVTSVDIAKAAISAVERNFEINNFQTKHEDIAIDAFEFIAQSVKEKRLFDLVITDPPSFAPNQKAVEKATDGYTRVYSDSLKLVRPDGLFAASSCSSHINFEMFLEITKESFAKARKKGTLVYLGGQPSDHPYPLAMEEKLRYLKFALFRVD